MSTGFAWLCDYQDMQKLEREVDALKEQLRQRDEQLKAANELVVHLEKLVDKDGWCPVCKTNGLHPHADDCKLAAHRARTGGK